MATWPDLVCDALGVGRANWKRAGLEAWAASEGMSPQANNPLAATDHIPGSLNYPPSPIVQVYPTIEAAADLYARKFRSSTYAAIGDALGDGGDLSLLWRAVNHSPWCLGCQFGKYPSSLYSLAFSKVAPPLPAVDKPPVQTWPTQFPYLPPPSLDMLGAWDHFIHTLTHTLPAALVHAAKTRGRLRRAVELNHRGSAGGRGGG